MRRASLSLLLLSLHACRALLVCGVEIPHARSSPASRVLDDVKWPDAFPYSDAELQPMMAAGAYMVWRQKQR